MMSLKPSFLWPRRHIAVIIGGACLAVGIGASFAAFGQDQSIATLNDVVFARKTLMVAIANAMYPIDEMRQTGKFDLPKGRAGADAISAMLMAFPHLFPPTTNTWTDKAPRDAAVDTFASPTLWQEYTFFYKQAQAASKYAFDLSHAENDRDFRKSATDLRLACDTCHAAFQKNN